jgi:hypothetical protein
MQVDLKKYVPVESNVYDIPERLQEIDPGYFVLLNRQTGKYEVHNSKVPTFTYNLTVPFEDLDSRTIDIVKEQRFKTNEQRFKEIDEWNEKLRQSKINKRKDTCGEITKDLYKYGKRTVREIPPITHTERMF